MSVVDKPWYIVEEPKNPHDKFELELGLAVHDAYYLCDKVLCNLQDHLQIGDDETLWKPLNNFKKVSLIQDTDLFQKALHAGYYFRENDFLSVFTNFGKLLEINDGDDPDTVMRKQVVLCAKMCLRASKWPTKDKEAIIAFQEPEGVLRNNIGIWLKINGYDSNPKAPKFYHLLQEFLANFSDWRVIVVEQSYIAKGLVCRKGCKPSIIAEFNKKYPRVQFNHYSSLPDFLRYNPLPGFPKITYGVNIAEVSFTPKPSKPKDVQQPEGLQHQLGGLLTPEQLPERLQQLLGGFQLPKIKRIDGSCISLQSNLAGNDGEFVGDDRVLDSTIETWVPTDPDFVLQIIDMCPEVYGPILGPIKEEIIRRQPRPRRGYSN